MPGDTGPTAQEIDYLNAINSGQGGNVDPSTGQLIQSGGPAPDTSGQVQAMQPDYGAVRDQIAQSMMAPSGGAGVGAGGGDPWAGYNPYGDGRDVSSMQRIQEGLAQRDANPYDQYFANRGPMSGSGDDFGWQNALQPWQGGSSGTLPGTGMNTSGFIGGGAQMRADPAYWGWTGPGTEWGTGEGNPEAAAQYAAWRWGDPAMGGGQGIGPGDGGGFGGLGGDGGGGGGGGGGVSGGGGPSGSGGYGGSPSSSGIGTGVGTAGAPGAGIGSFGYGAESVNSFGPLGGLGPEGPASGALGQVGVGLGIGTVGPPGSGIGTGFGPSSPGGWGAGATGISSWGGLGFGPTGEMGDEGESGEGESY